MGKSLSPAKNLVGIPLCPALFALLSPFFPLNFHFFGDLQGWEGVNVMNVVRKRCPGDPMEIGVGSFVAGCLRQVNSLAQAPEYGVGWCHRNNAHSRLWGEL